MIQIDICDYDGGKGKPERNLENQHKQAEKVFSEEHNAEADGGNHHPTSGT